jgi:hypothetical protein
MRLHEALNLHPHAAERRELSTGGTFSRCTALMPPEPSILRRVFDQPTRARDGQLHSRLPCCKARSGSRSETGRSL